jgi:predicted phosphoadenosine phosphosulfate sulfurtransferase
MRQKIKKYIADWELRGYSNGIPDEAPPELEKRNLVPSYRRIAIAILKNDPALKHIGLSGKVSKYYSAYKYIELNKENKQLKLDL